MLISKISTAPTGDSACDQPRLTGAGAGYSGYAWRILAPVAASVLYLLAMPPLATPLVIPLLTM